MISTSIRNPIFDSPWRWAENSSWPRPSFDVQAFQKRIDAIVGKTARGDSIVVLRWMRDKECFEKWYTQWDVTTPTAHELRARYKFCTIEDIPGQPGLVVDIPPPRWVLEQRYEPEQIAAEWEKTRWEMRDGVPRPLRDACPREGYYAWLLTIASHGRCGCENGILTVGDQPTVCWGRYAEPTEQVLTTLKRMMWLKRKDNLGTNPFEKPSEAVQEKGIKRLYSALADDKAKKAELQKDIIGDAIKQNLWKHTDDPTVLKHGKYHDLGKNKGEKQ